MLLAGAAHTLSFLAPFEDSYITYRYAENLASGRGLAYNPGERVEGFTSFLWTVLLAVMAKIGVPMAPVSEVLGLGFGLVCVGLAAALFAELTPHAPKARPCLTAFGVGAAAYAAAHGTWAYYAATGMETTLFAALVSLGALLAMRDRPLASGIALAISAIVRPEGVGYAGLVVAAVAIVPEKRRDAMRLAMAFIALLAPYFITRYAYFGYPVPNTYYAKATPSLDLFRAGAAHAESFLTAYGFAAAPVAAVALLARGGWRGPARVPAALVLGAILNAIFVGGDTFAFYRFFLPVIPAAGALIAFAAHESTLHLADQPSPVVRALPAAALSTLCLWAFAAEFVPTHSFLREQTRSDRTQVQSVERINADYFKVGAYLRDNAPKNALLAVNAAGIVPYVSGLRTLDMLGLNDIHIAHRTITLGHGAAGHEKHDAKYVLQRAPDIILLGLPVLAPRRVERSELDHWFGRWFPYLPGDRELYESKEFKKNYEPVGVDIDGRWLVMFARKQSIQ